MRVAETLKRKGAWNEMTNRLIELTNDTMILRTDAPRTIGANLDLEIKLPEGVLAGSFIVNGTITSCAFITNNGSSHYMLEIQLGKLSEANRKILEAYRGFLESEELLNEKKVDLVAIREAFDTLGSNLRQLRETAEELRDNIRGTLELMKRTAEGKTTVH
ncbi:MAG: hypothetical protein JRF24_04085 [Deltaproteobacteria bacterium]|nr:hypothetical protein [Deltaproteobacteria bacterium]